MIAADDSGTSNMDSNQWRQAIDDAGGRVRIRDEKVENLGKRMSPLLYP